MYIRAEHSRYVLGLKRALSGERRRLEEVIAGHTDRITSLIDWALEAGVDGAAINERLGAARADREVAAQRLAAINRVVEGLPAAQKRLEELLGNAEYVASQIGEFEPTRLREALRGIIEGIIVHPVPNQAEIWFHDTVGDGADGYAVLSSQAGVKSVHDEAAKNEISPHGEVSEGADVTRISWLPGAEPNGALTILRRAVVSW